MRGCFKKINDLNKIHLDLFKVWFLTTETNPSESLWMGNIQMEKNMRLLSFSNGKGSLLAQARFLQQDWVLHKAGDTVLGRETLEELIANYYQDFL